MKTLIATFVCSAVALAAISVHGAEQSNRPNIVFILADDMGYGDLGCYGAEKIQTPNIDRLAEEGILFTDGHCGASTCTPTRYGLMTGRHPWRSWCKYSALSTNAPLLIEEDRVTIASFLKSAGYSTSIVGKWHLGYGHEEGFEKHRGDAPPNFWETRGSGPNWNGELKPGPRENGFDYSYAIPVANSFPPYVFVENYHVAGLRKDSPIGNLESRNYGKMEGGEGARWTDAELIDKFADKLVSELEHLAVQMVTRRVSEGRDLRDGADPSLTRRVTKDGEERKPFFLYYTPTQPHIGSRVVNRNAHWPNARFKGTSQAGNYGDVVQELDWSVGVILETLDKLGLTENTLVIFTSDNGGYTRDFNGHRPNGPILRGGKGDLVEGGIRVPFLAKWPGRIKPRTRSKETVSTTDMLATFAAIIGKDLPAGAGPDSYNVLPALLGQKLPQAERPVVLSSGGTGAISIRAGKWKLIDGQGNCGYGEFRAKQPVPTPKPGDPPAQLYNLEEDLGEANNLYLKHPDIVHRLKVGLEKIKADENYNPTTLKQPKEKLTIEQLNALFRTPKVGRQNQGQHAATTSTPDVESITPDLTTPKVIKGEPEPGKRVLQALTGYDDSDVRHALYLPTDWIKGRKYPVIAEFTGNGGTVAGGKAAQGFGISGGEGYLWVTLPFVSEDGQQDMDWWWGSPERTADYAKAAIESICEEWGGNADAVILTGHSRGAIACNYIGLRDESIARLWLGMVPVSHYDNRSWNQTKAEQALRVERLLRLGRVPQYICGETHLAEKHNDKRLLAIVRERQFESIEAATRELNLKSILEQEKIRQFVTANHPDGNFTFDTFPWVNHYGDWILRDTPARTKLRKWVNDLVATKTRNSSQRSSKR